MREEGEGKLLLGQIRSIGKDILEDLMSLDDRLAALEERTRINEELGRNFLLEEIKEMRRIIGAAEHEDKEGMEEEEILENLIDKLNVLINKTL